MTMMTARAISFVTNVFKERASPAAEERIGISSGKMTIVLIGQPTTSSTLAAMDLLVTNGHWAIVRVAAIPMTIVRGI